MARKGKDKEPANDDEERHTNNTQLLLYITGHIVIREYTRTHSLTTQHTSHSAVSLASSPDLHIFINLYQV